MAPAALLVVRLTTATKIQSQLRDSMLSLKHSLNNSLKQTQRTDWLHAQN